MKIKGGAEHSPLRVAATLRTHQGLEEVRSFLDHPLQGKGDQESSPLAAPCGSLCIVDYSRIFADWSVAPIKSKRNFSQLQGFDLQNWALDDGGNRALSPLKLETKGRTVMTRFGLTAATGVALTLALAAPAMADNRHHAKGPMRSAVAHSDAYAYAAPLLPVQNALRWGYSQGYSNYPSGFGGLYGDGRYPGNVISNDNPRR